VRALHRAEEALAISKIHLESENDGNDNYQNDDVITAKLKLPVEKGARVQHSVHHYTSFMTQQQRQCKYQHNLENFREVIYAALIDHAFE
jgi:hypothetical protein